METLEFSLELAEQSVSLKTKDGSAKKYVLRELTAKQRGTYLNSMQNRIIFTDGKVTGIKDFDGLEASLLSRCLYDESNKLVSMSDLEEFPGRVLKKLFEAAQLISGLNEEGVKQVKNG